MQSLVTTEDFKQSLEESCKLLKKKGKRKEMFQPFCVKGGIRGTYVVFYLYFSVYQLNFSGSTLTGTWFFVIHWWIPEKQSH